MTGLDGGASAEDIPRVTRAEAQALRRDATRTHARLSEHLEPLRAANHGALRGVGEDPAKLTAACIHTVFRSATGNWANQIASGERVYGVYATKQECVLRGQDLARAAEVNHVIHDVDGAVSAVNRPRSTPGSP